MVVGARHGRRGQGMFRGKACLRQGTLGKGMIAEGESQSPEARHAQGKAWSPSARHGRQGQRTVGGKAQSLAKHGRQEQSAYGQDRTGLGQGTLSNDGFWN